MLCLATQQDVPGSIPVCAVSADGVGFGITRIFNEYYLLAYCGAAVEVRSGARGAATAFYERHVARASQAPARSYWGHGVLVDSPHFFLSSFITQYCFYLAADFANSATYKEFFKQAAQADKLWWQKAGVPPERGGVFGLGAGAYPSSWPASPYGYKACAIEDNDARVYSAPSVAGFLPVDDDAAGLLQRWHTQGDDCRYQLPSGHTLLWRASLTHPTWRAPTVEAVDFAPMLLGCAYKVLGEEWFKDFRGPPIAPHADGSAARLRACTVT